MIALWVMMISQLLWLGDGQCAVPNSVEPEYSEAVIDFTLKNTQSALKRLNDLKSNNPTVIEIQELRALALKGLQKDNEAIKQYADLVRLRSQQGGKGKDLAPYYFELGLLLSKQGKQSQARSYFEYSLKSEFNVTVSNFYLGLEAFQREDWENSERYFLEVVDSDFPDLLPAAHLYLGQIYLRSNYPVGATQHFSESRKIARKKVEDPQAEESSKKLARQTLEASERALDPYRESNTFGFASLSLGYDTNALSVPSSTASSSQTTDEKTAVGAISLGLGYSSSALKKIQWVPSYRASVNLHQEKDTRSAQFASHILTLYLNVNPLDSFAYGAKLEGSLLFRTEVDPVSDKGTFKRFSHGGSFGPYVRLEVARRWMATLELFADPVTYQTDLTSSADTKRSGTKLSAHILLQNERGARWLNPLMGMRLEADQAKGKDYNSQTFKAYVGNDMKAGERFNLSAMIAVASTEYAKRSSGKRNDITLTPSFNARYRLTSKWTILGNLLYVSNASNISSTYSYTRFSGSLGATYSLF